MGIPQVISRIVPWYCCFTAVFCEPDKPFDEGLLYAVNEMALARASKPMVLRTDPSPIPSAGEEPVPVRTRIFLLSPANVSGIKGQRLLNPTGDSDLALRLRNCGATLGEVYRFISSLYFRGKLDYAQRFQNPPHMVAGVQIITGAGLMLPETVITLSDLRRISAASIDERNSDYRMPLDSDLLCLRKRVSDETEVILLGSIATSKYITPIREVFGKRLLFPQDFLGIGDMSRGSMLLRCCAHGAELEYRSVETILSCA
jgi:hypothetical protein